MEKSAPDGTAPHTEQSTPETGRMNLETSANSSAQSDLPRSRQLAQNLTEQLNYGRPFEPLDDDTLTLLEEELAACLSDADTGETDYDLTGTVYCSNGFYFSMLVQGSRLTKSTGQTEETAFGVTLDLQDGRAASLSDFTALGAVRDALTQNDYTLARGSDPTAYPEIAGTTNLYELYEDSAAGKDTEDYDHYHDYYLNDVSAVGLIIKFPKPVDDYVIPELNRFHLMAWKSSDKYSPESLLTYEIRKEQDREYAVITGVRKAYREELAKQLRYRPQFLPETMEDIPVEEIAADAFHGISQDPFRVYLPEGIQRIGDRAFANNPGMWAVYMPNADCVIGEDAFADSDSDLYLICDEDADKEKNLTTYANANGLNLREWIPARLKVNYPETPIVLTPEIRNFFYGENADEEHFDFFELSEDAPDYGFEEWHQPCGEFCVGQMSIDLESSSELASLDGRYGARNLLSYYGRNMAWAEGVDGPGIGESITYRTCNDWYTNNLDSYINRLVTDSPLDGYIRYTEICIVNGYAKDQKTWEENGRVKTLLMYVEDRPYAELNLEDTILPQYFALPADDIMVPDGSEITFRFEIEDVYPGTTYEDTCLTGLVLEFSGRYGH